MALAVSPNEVALFMALIDRAADELSAHICDDLDGDARIAFDRFTEFERRTATRIIETAYGGEPLSYDPDWCVYGSGTWLRYLAGRIIAAAGLTPETV